MNSNLTPSTKERFHAYMKESLKAAPAHLQRILTRKPARWAVGGGSLLKAEWGGHQRIDLSNPKAKAQIEEYEKMLNACDKVKEFHDVVVEAKQSIQMRLKSNSDTSAQKERAAKKPR